MTPNLNTGSAFFVLSINGQKHIHGIVAADDWLTPTDDHRLRCGLRSRGEWWVLEGVAEDGRPGDIDDLQMAFDDGLHGSRLVPVDPEIAERLLIICDAGFSIPTALIDALRRDPTGDVSIEVEKTLPWQLEDALTQRVGFVEDWDDLDPSGQPADKGPSVRECLLELRGSASNQALLDIWVDVALRDEIPQELASVTAKNPVFDPWMGFRFDGDRVSDLCLIHPDSNDEIVLARWFGDNGWGTANPTGRPPRMLDLTFVDPCWSSTLAGLNGQQVDAVAIELLRRFRADEPVFSFAMGEESYEAIRRVRHAFLRNERPAGQRVVSERLAEWLDGLMRIPARELVENLAVLCAATAADPKDLHERVVHDFVEALVGRGSDVVHALHWVYAVREPGETHFTVIEHGFRVDGGWDEDMPWDDPRWAQELARLENDPRLVRELSVELGWEDAEADAWFMSDTITLDRITAAKVIELFDGGVGLTRGQMEWCSRPGHDVVTSGSVSSDMLATVALIIAETSSLPQSPPERERLIEWLTTNAPLPFSAISWALMSLAELRHGAAPSR